MSLYSSKSLRFVLERDRNRDALQLLDARLNALEWAVYRVRRIVWAKGRADRRTERLQAGTRGEVTAEVMRLGGRMAGHTARLIVRERGLRYPTVEEMVVATPNVVAEKSRASFLENWERLTGPGLWDAGEE